MSQINQSNSAEGPRPIVYLDDTEQGVQSPTILSECDEGCGISCDDGNDNPQLEMEFGASNHLEIGSHPADSFQSSMATSNVSSNAADFATRMVSDAVLVATSNTRKDQQPRPSAFVPRIPQPPSPPPPPDTSARDSHEEAQTDADAPTITAANTFAPASPRAARLLPPAGDRQRRADRVLRAAGFPVPPPPPPPREPAGPPAARRRAVLFTTASQAAAARYIRSGSAGSVVGGGGSGGARRYLTLFTLPAHVPVGTAAWEEGHEESAAGDQDTPARLPAAQASTAVPPCR